MNRASARRLGTAVAATVLVILASGAPASAAPATGGAELWEARYNGPAKDRSDEPNAMVVNAAGTRVFVTGWSADRVEYVQFATTAYVAGTGRKLWVSRLDQYYSMPQGIAVSPDGTRVFVTGVVDYPNGNYATVAYDAVTGAQLWYVEFGQPYEPDLAMAIGVSPDGTRVFVTGASGTVAYDASTGTPLWVATYEGGLGTMDLQVAPDGTRVYVTGTNCGGPDGTEDYLTVAYDAVAGAQIWAARYDGPDSQPCPFSIGDRSVSLAVSDFGARVYVTGSSPGRGGETDIATAAYDASTGVQRWARRYSVGEYNIFTGGVAVGVTPDGNSVLVTGTTASNSADFVTICYAAATGTPRWVSTYDGPANDIDRAQSLAVNGAGTQVYVTGRTLGASTDYDYATIAYDETTGAELWVALYNGPGNGYDTPSAIAVGPGDTAVYVTGASIGIHVSSDFLTIAYST